jgi:hypothetical protein
MGRSGNLQITGNELQAMVNEGLLGLRPGQTIPATNRCLTRAEVANRVYVDVGDSSTGAFIPFSNWDSGNQVYSVGPSPWLTCNWNYLNSPLASSVLFELNQEGNPYLNADLFAFANGSPLRLDPGSNLDAMFFGGPQYSPQMSSAVRVGMSIAVYADFGLNSPEGSTWGWEAPGYGFLEVYANGSLINNQSVYKVAASSANKQILSYTFNIQPGVSYYVKAWSFVTYTYDNCVGTNIIGPCVDCQSNQY